METTARYSGWMANAMSYIVNARGLSEDER